MRDEDLVGLDVHAVSELGNKGLSPTHDLPKFSYTANDKGEYGMYVYVCVCVCVCVCVHVSLFVFW